MGEGGVRGSRGGEKNHDVFSRTKQKVKALIEAHKLLLLEDLHEIMTRSSQAIYDAVVVRSRHIILIPFPRRLCNQTRLALGETPMFLLAPALPRLAL